jgi:hypothetical protein
MSTSRNTFQKKIVYKSQGEAWQSAVGKGRAGCQKTLPRSAIDVGWFQANAHGAEPSFAESLHNVDRQCRPPSVVTVISLSSLFRSISGQGGFY